MSRRGRIAPALRALQGAVERLERARQQLAAARAMRADPWQVKDLERTHEQAERDVMAAERDRYGVR